MARGVNKVILVGNLERSGGALLPEWLGGGQLHPGDDRILEKDKTSGEKQEKTEWAPGGVLRAARGRSRANI